MDIKIKCTKCLRSIMLDRETVEKKINDEDVKKAYETIERTKAEREQTQNIGKENNFEGR